MSTDTKKQPRLWGLWTHELAYLALLATAFYYSGAEFRGRSFPVLLMGLALVASVPVLAFRCRKEWGQLTNKTFFFSLAAVWVALFAFLGNSTFGYIDSNSLFAWMFDIYTSPTSDDQFGLFVPFVVLGLFWWKRQELVAQPSKLWWPGVLMVALGLLLHLVGYVAQQPKLSLIGFLGGLFGLTGLAWGKHWLKASFFPYFLLGFCVPIGAAADWLTLRLRLLVAWIVAGIAHLGLAPDLIRDGTQLFDAQHSFAYEVAAACSGIRSLMALLALTTIYSFVTFKSPWKRAVMISSALPLSVLGNVARLCCTIMVAELGGQQAGKAVETNFGFITFAVAIACVYLLSRWLEKGELKTPPAEQGATP